MYLPVTFWHRTKKLLNFLKPPASSNFSCCHSFIYFLYDPSSQWESPYPFSNGIVAIWYPSLSGWWIQFITSSLVSPLVYLISLKNCPQGSSILFLTTSLKIAIKFLQFRGFPAKRPISTSDSDCCFIRISLVPISCLLFSSINSFWSFVTWTSYLQP